MSVNPTEYDVIQDERIDEIESIITVSDSPLEGPEYSFPIPDYPVNQEQFQLLSLVNGNGIIDRGDGPYRLKGWGSDSETNQKNSMILTVGTIGERAEAVVSGYYHVLTQDMEIPLPPVATTTTYHICLTYDPRNEGSGGPLGPVSVQVYENSIPTTYGRVSAALHTVTRKPSQLLSDAEVTTLRPRVSPLGLVGSVGSLPKPSSVLYGTVAIVEAQNDIMVARNPDPYTGTPSEWASVISPKWSDLADNEFYGWPGHGYRRGYRKSGSDVELRGRIKRIDGATFTPGGGDHDQGYRIVQLPEDFAPKNAMRYITAGDGYASNKLAIISIESDGSVYGMPLLGNATWLGLDGIRFSARE